MRGKVLAEYPSKSRPNVNYEIVEGNDGVVYCTCPGWRTRKRCSHLNHFKRCHPVYAREMNRAKIRTKMNNDQEREIDALVDSLVANLTG